MDSMVSPSVPGNDKFCKDLLKRSVLFIISNFTSVFVPQYSSLYLSSKQKRRKMSCVFSISRVSFTRDCRQLL